MDSTRASENRKKREGGIALAMVLAAIAVLSILVTEFTYIAQVNQKMAFDGVDQVKAYYLAKSGYKLSLLRLKAYQNLKGALSSITGGGAQAKPGAAGGVPGVPKSLLDKIWSFPFVYPIPTNIPGLSLGEKEQIAKFQKESGFDGSFSAIIESESSKYNLNLILAPFAPTSTPSPSPTSGTGTAPTATASPSPQPSFNPQEARNSLGEFLFQMLGKKVESDPEFASEYRDYRVEDLVDSIAGWADPTYERKSNTFKESLPLKRGPFYSVSELHMVPGMDDKLYDLFAPALTVSTTPGININTMKEPTLRALVPGMTDEEVTEFFKTRDSEEEDGLFKTPDDFFKYLLNGVAALRHSQAEVDKLKENLAKRNIRLVVDETEFKITVQAQVNQSIRLLEAWVTLGSPQGSTSGTGGTGATKPPGNFPTPAPNPSAPGSPPDPGLRVTFMRTL